MLKTSEQPFEPLPVRRREQRVVKGRLKFAVAHSLVARQALAHARAPRRDGQRGRRDAIRGRGINQPTAGCGHYTHAQQPPRLGCHGGAWCWLVVDQVEGTTRRPLRACRREEGARDVVDMNPVHKLGCSSTASSRCSAGTNLVHHATERVACARTIDAAASKPLDSTEARAARVARTLELRPTGFGRHACKRFRVSAAQLGLLVHPLAAMLAVDSCR